MSPSGETKSSVNLGPIAGFQIPRAPYGSLPSGMLQQHSMRQDTNHSSSLGYSNQSRNDAGMMSWMRTPPQTRVGAWVDAHAQEQDFQARYRGVDQVLYYSINSPMKVPANTWTNVTTDPRLVEHLLALYFCWEYPTFASLSKEHFLQDFREGSSRFCSPILVNALLALGCRFSNAPNTRADPNDPYSSGDHFFREALRLFNEEINHHSLTTIQALGIMSIREASCGRDSESWFYAGQSIRLAIEMGLHLSTEEGDEDEMAVKSATFWGAFALDQYVTFHLYPYLDVFPPSILLLVSNLVHGLLLQARCLNVHASRSFHQNQPLLTTLKHRCGFLIPTMVCLVSNFRIA